MEKTIVLAILCAAVLMISAPIHASEKAPGKVIDLANTEIVKIGVDPVIVEAVKAENAKNKTMLQIQELDKKWMATPGVDDFMKALMDSECGKQLQTIQKSTAYYAEIFVMDNQGANVAMTDKTSDYWQGDEAKFTESYKGGQGGIHISDVEFDDSTQVYVVKVSVPVKDGDQVIGAVTVGMDIEKIE